MALISALLPKDEEWHGHAEAIGLGLGVMGIGFALAEIYKRPGLAYIGTATAVGLVAFHWNTTKRRLEAERALKELR